MKVDDQQEELMAALDELLQQFYQGRRGCAATGISRSSISTPRRRGRAAATSLTFSRMMSADLGPKKSSTWVK